MNWIRRFTSFSLILLMICCLFTGCKKELTSLELLEKYCEVYVAEEDQPIIWSYGREDQDIASLIKAYCSSIKDTGRYDKMIRHTLCYDLPLEQFGTKLQAKMMSGDEPDMIVTCQNEMLPDINKMIASGALAAWNEYETNWDDSLYYEKVLDGVYSPDGKHYLIPISFEPKFIITTKSTMKKYGLTEDSFSDFTTTTETIYQLWRTVESDVYPTRSRPDFTQVIDGILDYESRKTALLDEPNLLILKKWEEIFELGLQRSKEHPLEIRPSNLEYILNGNIMMEFLHSQEMLQYMIDLYKENYFMQEAGNEIQKKDISDLSIEELDALQKEMIAQMQEDLDEQIKLKLSDLVIIPLYDVNGRVVGNINSYVLMSAKAKGKDALSDFIQYLVEGEYASMSNQLNLATPHISCQGTLNEFEIQAKSNYIEGVFTGEILHEMIQNAEWNLRVPNATLTEYHDTITSYLYYPETADWEELERSINIYLSE